MRDLTKVIREATALNLDQFCEKYLETNRWAFTARLNENKLYPNEALLICLITGRNPVELFGLSTMELFFLGGKSEAVTKSLKGILKKPDVIEKLNLILSSPDGLKITPSDPIEIPRPPRIKKPRKPQQKEVAKVNEDTEWMTLNVFK